jgi:hypothetical protein
MKALPLIPLLLASATFAQDESADPAAASPAPCAGAHHREFDFWIGSWEVTANGEPAGRNEITQIHGGCALAESWVSARGSFRGSSLNAYDGATDQWHQTWVDTAGTLLELDGGFTDGQMVLSGKRPGPDGAAMTHRITWTPNDDGTVRQHWETSADGQAWTTVFDGLYARAGEPE